MSLVEKLRNEKYEKVLSQLGNVTHVEGQAQFVSTNEIEVDGQKYQAKKFIISAGSRATVIPESFKNSLRVNERCRKEARGSASSI